jgi:hypothetical protein
MRCRFDGACESTASQTARKQALTSAATIALAGFGTYSAQHLVLRTVIGDQHDRDLTRGSLLHELLPDQVVADGSALSLSLSA